MFRLSHLLVQCAIVISVANITTAGAAEDRPLSPAQMALFDTPHLSNVTRPETLSYDYARVGPDAFADKILVEIKQINPDGTKDLTFDYLTGAHHVAFPAIGDFRGNPLLMLVLDRDVAMMSTALGMSEAYFRNRIRESFLDGAVVTDTTVSVGGTDSPARTVVVTPFAHEQRLERIPSLQAKTYAFTLAQAVPGMIAVIRIDTPSDAALHAPEFSERITFAGVAQ